MFLLKVPKEKLYVWFDAPIGYISLKNGLYEKERTGNLLERSRH
jgi:methionyl-tRNA synthetase